jgi:hypothetical protein
MRDGPPFLGKRYWSGGGLQGILGLHDPSRVAAHVVDAA